MQSDRIALSKAWPNRGFCGMPEWMVVALRQALHDNPRYERPPVSPADLCRERLYRWESGPVPIDWDRIDRAWDTSLQDHQPRPRQQTIADIIIESHSQIYTSQIFGEVVGGWDYCRFAFTVYWALFFHLTNPELERPDEVYHELWWLAGQIAFAVNDEPRQPTWHERVAMALSLYERNRGIAYDSVMRKPHYLLNVVNRQALARREQQRRVELFTAANERFRQLLLAELP